MTVGEKFKSLARKYMPTYVDLQDFDESIDDADSIDDIMYSFGEYTGGMATVLLAIIEKEQQ